MNFSDEIENTNKYNEDDLDFKDNNSEEFTYHERTETTKTEKITSTKRRSAGKQQIDLGAAASQLNSTKSDLTVSFVKTLRFNCHFTLALEIMCCRDLLLL